MTDQMLKISPEIVESAQKYWQRNIKTSFLTFLACKYAGINQKNEVTMKGTWKVLIAGRG